MQELEINKVNSLMDDCNISLIQTTDKEVLEYVLKKLNTKKVFYEIKEMDMDFKEKHFNNKVNFVKSSFSIEYLEKVIKLCKAIKIDKVKISLMDDYPILFESEKFNFIIAPRVEAL